MVDRCERWEVQDEERKDLRSKCHFCVARDKDWVAVSNGQPGGTLAYMSGRLKIRGDQGLARKLGQIFP